MGSQAWVLRFRMGLHVADDGRGENMKISIWGKMWVLGTLVPCLLSITTARLFPFLLVGWTVQGACFALGFTWDRMETAKA